MDLNELENRLKNSSERQEEQVDTGALWSVVQKELREEKKRRPLFMWLMFGLIAMAGSVMLYTANVTTDSDNSLEGIKAQRNSIIANSKALALPISIKSEAAQPIEGNQIAKNSISNPSITNEIRQPNEESKLTRKAIIAGSSFGKSDQARKLENVSTSQNLKKNFPINFSTLAEPIYEQELRGDLNEKEDGDISTSILGDTKYKSTGVMDFENQPSVRTVRSALLVERKLIEYKVAPEIPMIYSSILPLGTDLNTKLAVIAPFEKSSFFSTRERASWSIGLTAGATINNAVLSSTIDDVRDLSYLTRNESLSTLVSWNTSLRIGRRLSDYLWIQSGVEVHSILNKSTKQLMFQEEVLRDGVVVEQIIGPNGITDIIGQAVVLQETISLRTRISKSYELSIPLMLQFELPEGRLRPFFAFGIDYSFLLGRSGLIHLNSSEEYDIAQNQETLLNTQLGWSARVQLGAKTQLSESINLTTIMGYRKSLYSHFRMESGISEKYNSIKLQLGIEHQF